jgi:hypothetical protein
MNELMADGKVTRRYVTGTGFSQNKVCLWKRK